MFSVLNISDRVSSVSKRNLSISSVQDGKFIQTIKQFPLYNKRGTRQFKKNQMQRHPMFPDIPIHRNGVRNVGIQHFSRGEFVPEKVPELIVPDLTGCKLKPYVSYATKEIHQEELTSKDLFNVIYGPKIIADFKAGKLDENGNPVEPSELEQQSAEEAYIRARQTGSDIFQGGEQVNPLIKIYKQVPVGKL